MMQNILEFPSEEYYNVVMAHCYFCGREVQEKIFRSSLCEECGKPLKICRNCRFYAPGEQHDCREHIAEAVFDKERENFCDYFSPAEGTWEGDQQRRKAEEAKQKFRSLFDF